jgi:hypothetical protein
MNCLALEKTLVPLPLCELDTKEKLTTPKGRCKEMTRGARSRSWHYERGLSLLNMEVVLEF